MGSVADDKAPRHPRLVQALQNAEIVEGNRYSSVFKNYYFIYFCCALRYKTILVRSLLDFDVLI